MRRLVALLIIVLFPFSVWASSDADQLNTKLESLSSFVAMFTQEVVSDDGSMIQESKGSVAIMRPGMFRWVTVTPLDQKIVTNGETLWIYEPDLEQVTVKQLDKNLGDTPLVLLTEKNIVLQNSFSVKQLPSKPNGEIFQLQPLDQGNSFKMITLKFENNKLLEMVLMNKLNQKTTIHFSNTQLNVPLPPQLFHFSVPKGTQVINANNTSQ